VLRGSGLCWAGELVGVGMWSACQG
jgi:hypothetical protein